MSKEIESISAALFDKVRSRFPNVTLGDEKAKATTDPSAARFFNFMYTANATPESGEEQSAEFGKVTISLIDETSLKVYYGLNISANMDRDQRKEWYEFLRNLRQFAKRNLLTFDTRDINKSNLELQDVKQQSKTDDVATTADVAQLQMNEGKMYGTARHSFVECGQTRLRIVHTGIVNDDVRGARSRQIKDIFVETPRGERFLLPFKNLHGARAMGQHIDQGGELGDDEGRHICELVQEMASMSHFVRSTKRRQFEDQETADMTNAAVNRYSEIKHTLRHMANARGYQNYFETFLPAENPLEEIDVDALKERFVKKVYDERFNDALPYVYRAHKRYNDSLGEYGAELGEWANTVSESTWAKPDNADKVQALRELLKQPLPVGIDGVDAKSKIEEIIGDDELNDDIENLAVGNGPDADARPLIKKWLLNIMPQLLKDLNFGEKNADNAATNWAQPVSPEIRNNSYGDSHGGRGDDSSSMTY
jgi:hypothetical protein